MSNKTVEQLREMTSVLNELTEKSESFFERFGADNLIELRERSNEVSNLVSDLRKDHVEEEIHERAVEGGLRNEDGCPILVGDDRYARSASYDNTVWDVDLLFDKLQERLYEAFQEAESPEELSEEVNDVFEFMKSLMSKNPFNKNPVLDAIDEAEIPRQVLRVEDAKQEDHEEDPNQIYICEGNFESEKEKART